MAWPSIWLALAGAAILMAALVCSLRWANATPELRRTMLPGTAIFIGGLLNFAAITANAGYMPCALNEHVAGMYMPLDGANLAHLSDWVWGFVSPGDIIIAAGTIGIVAVLVVEWWWKGRATP